MQFKFRSNFLGEKSALFSLDASLIDVRVFISLEINTYPRYIRCSSNLGQIFSGENSASYRPGNMVYLHHKSSDIRTLLTEMVLVFETSVDLTTLHSCWPNSILLPTENVHL
jgi:hypothetical protein